MFSCEFIKIFQKNLLYKIHLGGNFYRMIQSLSDLSGEVDPP